MQAGINVARGEMALDRVARDVVGAIGDPFPGSAETLLDLVKADQVDAAGQKIRLPRLRQQYLDPFGKAERHSCRRDAVRSRWLLRYRRIGLGIEESGKGAPEAIEEPVLRHPAHAPSPRRQPPLRQRLTRFKKSSGSNGLAMTSDAPSFCAILRKSVLPMRPPPEMAMTLASGRSRRISVIVWMPSFSGMMMSVITRSGFSLINEATPRLPSSALITS